MSATIDARTAQPAETRPETMGVRLVRLLEAYGVDVVFGIPGVHTVELYRGLEGSAIRHVTPRHEQGAAFMADGYARASGKPGVCLLITGPGLANAATPMAQALADSVPMLVLTGVNVRRDLGMGRGALHEMPNQHGFAREVARFSQTILDADQLDETVARAFAVFGAARPGPVHIEIPIDLMAAPGLSTPLRATTPHPPAPAPAALDAAAEALRGASRPLILAGGGAVGRRGDGQAIAAAAAAFGAPVVQTTNARGVLRPGDELSAPASPTLDAVRAEIAASDVVLAVGTELGETDYGIDKRRVDIPGALLRLDIDAAQSVRNHAPSVALVGDAETGLAALAERAPPDGAERTRSRGADRTAALRAAALAELSEPYRAAIGLIERIWSTLPGARIVGDSTQAVYAGDLWCEAPAPRRWFNAATGFGALGYGLPAAIGARLADPTTPTVCLVGDGGLMFALGEMASAVEADAPVIVVVWNNSGYGEIKRYMLDRGIAALGVDLETPDFVAIGRAMGWRAERLTRLDEIDAALRSADAARRPSLIELPEALIWPN